MSDIIDQVFCRMTQRQWPVRRFNPRKGLLALALLGSAACITPPLAPAAFAQAVSAQQSTPESASFTAAFDYMLRLNADKTGELIETRRVKVQGIAAVQQVAQQNVQYVQGMQSLDIVAAYTEKADGTRLPVDPATIITRDGASGLAASYLLDLKVVTVIFPDVAVGDTLVLTTRWAIHSEVFDGHFEQAIQFPRTISRADSTVQVIAPSSLPLKVGVQGEGMQHVTTVEGSETRHVITHRGHPATPAEDRMTSPRDRDPAVFISTFADYEEMARSYWDGARPAMAVTPEIAGLANDITRGIDDKRAQAQAISAWVKANIRYVFVGFGTTRVVPHAAAAVLKNRYGDCKDHAALMSALLAAKGIAVEHVLINSGNSYVMPEPPTMAAFNHVILYLPEFGTYDDPTAQFAPFGVLGTQEYDKPVVRVSDGDAQHARTAAMKPEDHVSTRRTRLTVAADGVVAGETEQSGTGWFAMNARSIAASVQANGLEKSVEESLRRSGTPGKGRFEIGSLRDLGDSYSARARFTYDGRMVVKPSTNFNIPTGLGLQVRPGDFLLDSRLPGRKLPFTCFAGTQVEEIELTFAEGLPLPQKIDGRRIETKSFVYTAGYRLEDRTLKVRREFVSRVPGQVCAAEIEADIAQPMRDVFASNATRMAFAVPGQPPAAPGPTDTFEIKRTVVVDRPVNVDFIYAINPDCSSIGVAGFRMTEEAKHGKFSIEKGTGFTNFAQDNPRQVCNRRRSEGTVMHYQPEAGYLGPDSVTVDVVYGDGTSRKRHYDITINPAPAPTQVTRAAVAGQEVRIGFYTNLNPDCSFNPFTSARIVEGPQHGEAVLKEDTGFTSYAKENSRFECNSNATSKGATGPRSSIAVKMDMRARTR
jgi:transglutaminase-like putative cysteine protease